MILTHEQEAIIAYAQTGESLGIQAAAGTGKTSTLIALIRAMQDRYPIKRMQYLCFNHANANDSRAKLPPGTQVDTLHAVAFRAYGKPFQSRFAKSLWPIVKQFQQSYASTFPKLVAEHAPQTHAQAIAQTITRFCQSADPAITAEHVPTAFLRALPEATQAPYATQIAQLSQHAWEHWPHIPQWKIAQDWYLKAWALQNPTLPCDLILFDEAQDANPMILHLLEAQPAQKIYAGDPYQQLYAWRGAINALQAVPHQKLPLQSSWRFGTNLARLANSVLEPLQPEYAINGRKDITTIFKELHHPRAEVFRTNAGVLQAAIQAIQAGKRPHIVGGSQDVTQLLKAMHSLHPDHSTPTSPVWHPDLAGIESWSELEQAQSVGALGTMNPLFTWVQKYPERTTETIRALTHYTAETEHDADVILSTVHKAKGRQWNSVKLGNDFQAPIVPDAPHGTPHIHADEIHCLYVAVTRAEYVLDWNAIHHPLQESLQLWRKHQHPDRVLPVASPTPAKPTPSLAL